MKRNNGLGPGLVERLENLSKALQEIDRLADLVEPDLYSWLLVRGKTPYIEISGPECETVKLTKLEDVLTQFSEMDAEELVKQAPHVLRVLEKSWKLIRKRGIEAENYLFEEYGDEPPAPKNGGGK